MVNLFQLLKVQTAAVLTSASVMDTPQQHGFFLELEVHICALLRDEPTFKRRSVWHGSYCLLLPCLQALISQAQGRVCIFSRCRGRPCRSCKESKAQSDSLDILLMSHQCNTMVVE